MPDPAQSKRVIAAVKAIVRQPGTGKFLIIRHNDVPGWEIPGGKVEHGENPNDGVVREVFEETGLRVKITRSLGVWFFFRTANQGDGAQIVCSTFECEPLPGARNALTLEKNPALDEDIGEFKWVTKTEFLTDAYPAWHESLKTLVRDRL